MQTLRLRRDATRVIYEILLLGTAGASKTGIIFKVNLSHGLAERYTTFLVKKGLLRLDSDAKSSRYFITLKGESLLKLLRAVEKELDDLYTMSLSTEPTAQRQSSRIAQSVGNERGRVPIEIQRAFSS